MPLPLCVLPGILGAGERVAPGEGAENWRDGRMISAPTNHREPAPGGRTLCAPTKNGGASRRAGHRLVRKSGGGGAGEARRLGGGKRQNRHRRAKASRPWDGWPWLDRGERVRNGISKVWSKELEGKELLPAGHHIGGDFTGIRAGIILS